MDDVRFELLTRLLNEHGPRLMLYASQWCRTPADVVQEAFVKLMREQPPRDASAWLYQVVRNAAITASRTEARRTRRDQPPLAMKRGSRRRPAIRSIHNWPQKSLAIVNAN